MTWKTLSPPCERWNDTAWNADRAGAPSSRMNIAIIGCGYVAEFYAKTLGNYPELELIGAYDRNDRNLQAFCRRWSSAGLRELRAIACMIRRLSLS